MVLTRLNNSFSGLSSDVEERTSSTIWSQLSRFNIQIDPNPTESKEEAAVEGSGSGQGRTGGIRRRRGQEAGFRLIRRLRQRRNRAPPAESPPTIDNDLFKDIPIVKYFESIGLKETMAGVVSYNFYPNKTLVSDLTLVSYAVAFAALYVGSSTKAICRPLSNVLTELGTHAAFTFVFGAFASQLPIYFSCVLFICWLSCAVCIRLQFSAARDGKLKTDA